MTNKETTEKLNNILKDFSDLRFTEETKKAPNEDAFTAPFLIKDEITIYVSEAEDDEHLEKVIRARTFALLVRLKEVVNQHIDQQIERMG